MMRAYNISSAIHKVPKTPFRSPRSPSDTPHQILGFQAVFKSSIRYPAIPTFRAMSSIAPIDTEVNRVIDYWFDVTDEPQKKWFMGGAKVDEEIKIQFSGLVTKARASELTSWTSQPKSTLALLILLDQFPRNIFRGSPLSYSSDSMAVEVATKAIAEGFDRKVEEIRQPFFYLPLMHDENLLSQVAGVALYENLAARCPEGSLTKQFSGQSIGFAKAHLNVILKFGRYPSRNEVLGRESTREEIEYLKEHPSGF
jgi:uncharacterized protein (DUF924 family)